MTTDRTDGDNSMSKGGKSSGDVFDIERIRQIVELMEEHELSEVDLQQGDDKIRLARGSSAPVYMQPSVAHAAPASPAPTVATGGATPPPSGSPPAGTITINSPMVGTFYCRANPESEPFVKVGSMVTEDSVVCIIEAMKVFNEIPAECRGKIVEVLVGDQQAVDFGKPLFRVEKST